MKKITFILSGLLLLLASACSDAVHYEVYGTLYTDATYGTALPSTTLSYCFEEASKPIGYTRSDNNGKFAFAFWSNGADTWDQPGLEYKVGSRLLILQGDDTLYRGPLGCAVRNKLQLCPGVCVEVDYFEDDICMKGGVQ